MRKLFLTMLLSVILLIGSTISILAADNSSVIVTLPSFKVTINGTVYDNVYNQYPLIVYNDITYFPMTWRFCVDEFEWQYNYDNTNGLIISSNNSAIKQLGALPYQSTEENRFSNVIINSKYVYYEATNGHIMQALLSDLSQTKMVFQLPMNNYFKDYCIASLIEKDDIDLLLLIKQIKLF